MQSLTLRYMEDLPWSWEIDLSGSGPHQYLLLEFTESEAQLERTLGPFLAPDYERCDTSLLWMHKDSTEWCYSSVQVRGSTVEITRGWGGRGDWDAKLTQEILAAPILDLVHWRVLAGGDGYASMYFRSGVGVASLFDYCRAEIKEPDFAFVLQQLGALLTARGLSGRYRLGEPLFERVGRPPSERTRMKVPVFYDVLLVNGAWQSEPAASELLSIAREVSDRRGIPASASATSLHAPDDFSKLIGGQFRFGV